MFNTVILSGRLTADAELKSTTQGVSVTNFTIAVQRPKRKDEEEKTDFIRIVVWGKQAEFVTKYFRKGNMIGIQGTLQVRQYEDKDGIKRSMYEVVANNVQFVESKREENPEETQPNTSEPEVSFDVSDEDLPF